MREQNCLTPNMTPTLTLVLALILITLGNPLLHTLEPADPLPATRALDTASAPPPATPVCGGRGVRIIGMVMGHTGQLNVVARDTIGVHPARRERCSFPGGKCSLEIFVSF